MAWQNIFDVGECALNVHKDGSPTAMTPGEMTADGVTLSADVSGLCTLETPDNGAIYEARITPEYTTGSFSVRLSTMSCDSAIPGGTEINAAWDGVADAPALSFLDPPNITPDPAAFTPAQAWTYVGLSIVVGGG